MAKTRRTKTNHSPGRPYRNAQTYIVMHGDKVTTTGFRGRTKVKRVTDETGKRIAVMRVVEDVPQSPAKTVGKRKPVGIFIGRQYTGVARGKPYPYRGAKRGGKPPKSSNAWSAVKKAVKRVVVGEAAE